MSFVDVCGQIKLWAKLTRFVIPSLKGIFLRNQTFFVRILHNSRLAHIVHDVLLSHNIIIKI